MIVAEDWIPWGIAVLALAVSGYQTRQGRHSTKHYSEENLREADEKRRTEVLVQDEIMGHDAAWGVPKKLGFGDRLTLLQTQGRELADNLAAQGDTLDQLAELTADMHAELHPNGGLSMKDQLTALVRWKDAQT